MSLLLTFLLFVALCVAQPFSIDLGPGQISPASPSTITINPLIQGNVTIELADVLEYNLTVCFQEYVYLLNDLSQCNGPSGTFEPGQSTVVLDNGFARDTENFQDQSTSDDLPVLTLSNVRSVQYIVYFQNGAPSNSSAWVDTVATIRYNTCAKTTYGPNCNPGVSVAHNFVSQPTANFSLSTSANYYLLNIPFNVAYFSFNLMDNSAFPSAFDITFYARRSAAPTTTVYDLKGTDMMNGSNPLPGTWFVYFPETSMLKSLFLDVTVISCGWLEVYSEGVCVSINATDLTNATMNNVTSVKATQQYDYYTVTNTTLVLGVGTSSGLNLAPPIYSSFLSVPDNSTFLISSVGNNVNFFYSSSVLMNSSFVGGMDNITTWIVSVWSDEDYYIWANVFCPKNCSSKGNCTEWNGTCTCQKGYKGLYCQNHGLPLIVIILIAIGAAIILAIVIGVPVACYIRNSRKASYSRV